jgi:hypothetical protein
VFTTEHEIMALISSVHDHTGNSERVFCNRPMLKTTLTFLLALGILALTPLRSATLDYSGVFMPMNNSGVTGTLLLSLNGNSLNVQIDATGLESGQMHPMHIHGRLDAFGNPLPPLPPTDTDKDTFIETPEAIPAIGDVLLPLDTPPGSGNFPIAGRWSDPLQSDLYT